MYVRSIALYRFSRGRRLSSAPAKSRRNETVARSPRRTSPLATYVICTNPRSGSWLLGEGLASTSLAGKPREWFNPLVEQQRRAQWRMNNSTDLTYAKYLDQIRAQGTTSNGICGIKLHYYQFDELPKMLTTIENLRGLSTAEVMAAAFPNIKYIWLTRRDKARQAISYQLASTMGEWWIIDGAKRNKREDRIDEPDFDPRVIARLEITLAENDLKWQSYFQNNNIVPLTVYYEDLVSDYRGNIVTILKWLGVPNADAVAIPPSRLKQQSNARNEDWLARYKAFKTEPVHLAQSPKSVEISSPLAKRSKKPFDVIPDVWKRWIARNKLLKTPDDAIVEVLASNGYSRESAIAEVGKAASDPI
jgi:LPS sulfotransferase NodH